MPNFIKAILHRLVQLVWLLLMLGLGMLLYSMLHKFKMGL